jgi:hypothetical protein
MTMRYTHIGMDDQAKALAALPMPTGSDQGALQMCRISVGSDRLPMSPDDATQPTDMPAPETPKPRQGGAYDVGSPELSTPDNPGDLWRRRELHPRARSSNHNSV